MTDLDEIRSYVYDVTLATGLPPLCGAIAGAVESSESSVREALAELSTRRVLVLQPDGEILMAPPFSAVPTPYVVTTESFSGFANCGWDALGAAVMLQRPTVISASCADCGQALRLESDGHSVGGDSLVLHFPIPAHRWWESIVFT